MNKAKPKQVYTVRLDEALNDSINDYSQNNNMTRSSLIRHAVFMYLRGKQSNTHMNV